MDVRHLLLKAGRFSFCLICWWFQRWRQQRRLRLFICGIVQGRALARAEPCLDDVISPQNTDGCAENNLSARGVRKTVAIWADDHFRSRGDRKQLITELFHVNKVGWCCLNQENCSTINLAGPFNSCFRTFSCVPCLVSCVMCPYVILQLANNRNGKSCAIFRQKNEEMMTSRAKGNNDEVGMEKTLRTSYRCFGIDLWALVSRLVVPCRVSSSACQGPGSL